MKKALPLVASILFMASCAGEVSSSSALSSVEPSSEPASSALPTSSEESSSVSSGISSDPYAGRIKAIDMTILDLTNAVVSSNDPRWYEDDKPIDQYRRKDKVRMYYLDKIEDLYYIDLASYASIFKDELGTGMSQTVTDKDGVSVWTISQNDKPAYRLTLDAHNLTVTAEPLFDANLVKPIYAGKSSLMDYASFTEDFVKGHEFKPITVSFADYGFDLFEVDGKFCYPFPLLAYETSKVIDRCFLNISANQELLEYGESTQIENTNFLMPDGTSKSAQTYLREAYEALYMSKGEKESFNVEPETLRVFNKKLFYYIMDNYYGLAKEKGIASMSKYFENTADGQKFTEEKGSVRGSAYARAIGMLNDLHSSYGYSSLFGEFATEEASYSQTMFQNRVDLMTFLTNLRSKALKSYAADRGIEDVHHSDVRYSKDGESAYFSFDGFSTFSSYEEKIPESAYLGDSFYLFVKNLTEAKAKGVKNVIIDDSCNGGGYVAIMGKLLALMSKDNKSEMFMRNDTNGAISRITTRVDSNKDGVYDEKDCFGNDFKFYIVTSNYSFSCGNAFPVYATYNRYAKIIGQRSGGGECAVYGYSFPSGQTLGYSSPFHIGVYDAEKDVFTGDEAGASPSIPVSQFFIDLYDVDAVSARIKATESAPKN